MAKEPEFPKQIAVAIEEEGNGSKYLNAQKAYNDFSFDDQPTRTVALYQLQKVVVLNRMIKIEDK